MMAIPNPFYRTTPNTIRKWAYTFELTPEHMKAEEMVQLRYSYDKLADEALVRLQALQSEARKSVLTSTTSSAASEKSPQSDCPFSQPISTDLFTLLQSHQHEDPVLSKLWTQVSTVPTWVDWDQISRGQDVLYRYGLATLTGLAFQSLLGGLSAGRVVETLSRTGGFSTKVVQRRLFETTMHVLQVTRSLENIKPGGEGWISSIRVRLLHSSVRQRIMSIQKDNPGYYNVEAWGIPANDLDSIATIVTFSSTLLFQALPRQGLFPTQQEAKDYLALWRYIAYLFGTPDSAFSTPDLARRMMESLILHELNPTPVSCILANNMLSGMSDRPPMYATRPMLAATARWLIGHDLCDALDIPNPSFYYYLLMVGSCLYSMSMTYTARYVPAWDAYRLQFLRRAFWRMIVESDYGLGGKQTRFEMKYVPRLGKMTELEAAESDKNARIMRKPKGIEARNLKTVGVSMSVLALLLWITFLIVKFLVVSVWK